MKNMPWYWMYRYCRLIMCVAHTWRTWDVRLAARLECNKFSIFYSWVVIIPKSNEEDKMLREQLLLFSILLMFHSNSRYVSVYVVHKLTNQIYCKQSHGSVHSDFKWGLIETFYSMLYPYSACRWRFLPTLCQLCFSVLLYHRRRQRKKKKNAHTEFPDVSDCYSSGLGLLVPIEQLYSSLFTLSRARQFLWKMMHGCDLQYCNKRFLFVKRKPFWLAFRQKLCLGKYL